MLPSTNAPNRRSSSGRTDGTWSTLITTIGNVIMSLPSGMRALVLIVLALIAATAVYARYVPRGNPRTPDSVLPAAPYVNGIPDPTHAGADNGNPQNIEADDRAKEDSAAIKWHFDHKSEDDPPEISIDSSSQVFYRYYSKSDHCVYVRRQNGDFDQTQWVKDPNYHRHDVHTPQPHNAADGHGGVRAADAAVDVKQPGQWIFPVLSASTLPIGSPVGQMNGQCLNPHPGQFRYWWGTPVDQCNSPMYRQFSDGCTHYQIYNRCANAWDSRINWTMCVAQHKW